MVRPQAHSPQVMGGLQVWSAAAHFSPIVQSPSFMHWTQAPSATMQNGAGALQSPSALHLATQILSAQRRSALLQSPSSTQATQSPDTGSHVGAAGLLQSASDA